jgi:hypothetical protein
VTTPSRRLRRAARRAVGLCLGVVAVRLALAVAGELATVTVLALVLVGAGVAWWARVVEPRLFAPRAPPPAVRCPQRPAPSDAAGHLAFARALAAAAERYLAECERRADLDRPPIPEDDRT